MKNYSRVFRHIPTTQYYTTVLCSVAVRYFLLGDTGRKYFLAGHLYMMATRSPTNLFIPYFQKSITKNVFGIIYYISK